MNVRICVLLLTLAASNLEATLLGIINQTGLPLWSVPDVNTQNRKPTDPIIPINFTRTVSDQKGQMGNGPILNATGADYNSTQVSPDGTKLTQFQFGTIGSPSISQVYILTQYALNTYGQDNAPKASKWDWKVNILSWIKSKNKGPADRVYPVTVNAMTPDKYNPLLTINKDDNGNLLITNGYWRWNSSNNAFETK